VFSMRASHRERESVFQRPPDLDAIVARAAEASSRDEDPGSGRWDADDFPSREDRYGGGGGGGASAAELEEAQREAEVAQQQAAHLEKQLRGAIAELELHKRHGREFKALLEQSEADLCASHEHTADLQQRLQLAQEGNRRNADMAQQLLKHLNSSRVELKAHARRVAQLEERTTHLEERNAQLEDLMQESARGGEASGALDTLLEGAALDSLLEGVDGIAPAPRSIRPASLASGTDERQSGVASSRTSIAWAAHGRASTSMPLLAQLSTRAALTPVTHDMGVQVDFKSTRTNPMRMGSVARIALQHAREIENAIQPQKAIEALGVEARPSGGGGAPASEQVAPEPVT